VGANWVDSGKGVLGEQMESSKTREGSEKGEKSVWST